MKVLDFGLAKLSDAAEAGEDPGSAPTVVRGQSPTLAGVIMGTAGYMAPEQARGPRVDQRADIWAFGVVLYEMLTGQTLFPGDTVSDTLARVLKTGIDWSALPAATPPSIQRLLRRALERDRRNRLGRLVATLTLGWGLGVGMRPAPPTPAVARFGDPQDRGGTFGHGPAVSPDGRRIAAVVHTKVGHGIVVRSLDGLTAQLLSGGSNMRGPFCPPTGGRWRFSPIVRRSSSGWKLAAVPR